MFITIILRIVPNNLKQALGTLINESHDSLKVNYNVSIEELDNLTQVNKSLLLVTRRQTLLLWFVAYNMATISVLSHDQNRSIFHNFVLTKFLHARFVKMLELLDRD